MAKCLRAKRLGRPGKEPARLQESNSWMTEASGSLMPIAWQDANMAFLRSVLSL